MTWNDVGQKKAEIRQTVPGLEDKKYHHLAAVFDGREFLLWFDFQMVKRAKVVASRMQVRWQRSFCVGALMKGLDPPPKHSGLLYVGSGTYSTFFKGQMKEVKIFGAAKVYLNPGPCYGEYLGCYGVKDANWHKVKPSPANFWLCSERCKEKTYFVHRPIGDREADCYCTDKLPLGGRLQDEECYAPQVGIGIV